MFLAPNCVPFLAKPRARSPRIPRPADGAAEPIRPAQPCQVRRTRGVIREPTRKLLPSPRIVSPRHQPASHRRGTLLQRTGYPLPRKGAPAPTDADDRFADSRHPHRTVASNGSRSSGAPRLVRAAPAASRALASRALRNWGPLAFAGVPIRLVPMYGLLTGEPRCASAFRPERERPLPRSAARRLSRSGRAAVKQSLPQHSASGYVRAPLRLCRRDDWSSSNSRLCFRAIWTIALPSEFSSVGRVGSVGR